MFFPEDNIDDIILSENAKEEQNTAYSSIGISFEYDFTTSKYVIKDGKVSEISGINAVKQWIVRFINTMAGCVPIYKGTKFGSSFQKLRGYKTINNGYIESEIEREIREGLTLCPSIKNITNFNLEREGDKCLMSIDLELYTGEATGVTISV